MFKSKIRLPKKLLKILVATAIPVLVILASYFKVCETFELATLDLRFNFRIPQKISDNVVIIELADDTLNELGEWPIGREYHAALVDILTYLYNAKAIVFDVIFSQKSHSAASDNLFIDSVRRSGRTYVASVLQLSKDRVRGILPEAMVYESEPLPSLSKAAKGIGHINATIDIDGKRRRAPLLIDYDGELIPQLSFLAICDYLGTYIKDIEIEKSGYIRLSPDLRIPIDSDGQMMVNFAGRWGEAFRHYSFVDVLRSYGAIEKGRTPVIHPDELRDKICIIGLTAVATHDLDPIPLQRHYPMVGLHANLVNTILTKSFIISVNRLVNLLILVFLSIVVILSVLRLRPILSILSVSGIFFGFILVAFTLFGFFNIWIDLFYPVVLIAGVYIFCTFYKYITERNKRLLMEKELDIAQRIQRSFLKEVPPQKEGLDIGVIMSPAKSVGGDLYDFVEVEDKVGIMIGDVSGKGVPAALFMAKTVSEFRFCAKTEEDPLKVVTKLNEQISAESTSGLFVTLSYVVVDAAAKRLLIVDAGHLPIVYAAGGKETSLISSTGGMAIGIMDGVEFNRNEIAVEAEDIFVLYTDGVTEARNVKKEEFGEKRLKELVSRYKESPAKDIAQRIHDELKKFIGKAPQHDDITLIVLKIQQ